jgi:biopolymer transport protein ExbB/biopolymer transport protein TolQ
MTLFASMHDALSHGAHLLANPAGGGAVDFSLGGIWRNMGAFARGIVAVLAVMSGSSVLIVSERLLYFRRSRGESEAYAADLGTLVAGGKLDEAAARKLDLAKAGYLGRTLQAGLRALAGTSSLDVEARIESVARALERQTLREAALLKRGLGVLASVASSSPFVGLLGTVMGIVTAFQNMAASGSGGLGSVSAGIAEALVTTAFGLLVAIPSLLAFNWGQGGVDERQVDLAESSNELLDAVARHLRASRAA